MEIKTDISDLSSKLFKKSIDFLTINLVFLYDESKRELFLNPKEIKVDPSFSGYTKHWIIFSTGMELLIKSVLLKYDCLPISRVDIKSNKLIKSADNYKDAFRLFNGFAEIFSISSKNNCDIAKYLVKNKIKSQYELNLGNLGDCREYIKKLFMKNIITNEDYNNIYNSVLVLATVRRNIDIHNYSNLNVLLSINGDLENLYLPMINTLLKKI